MCTFSITLVVMCVHAFVHYSSVRLLVVAVVRVTTFLEFLEARKCRGILQRSGKNQGKGTKSGKGQGICLVRDI